MRWREGENEGGGGGGGGGVGRGGGGGGGGGEGLVVHSLIPGLTDAVQARHGNAQNVPLRKSLSSIAKQTCLKQITAHATECS